MKWSLLLPNRCRRIGWLLLPFAIALLVAVIGYEYSIPLLKLHSAVSQKFDLTNDDMSDEASIFLVFVSLFMIAFSKEKVEDEYIAAMRLKALQLSVYVNYLVLAIGLFSFYGLNFLYVLYGNLFTILIIFIAVYYYQVHFKSNVKPVDA